MELCDSHCHLDFPEFDHDRNEVIEQCDQLGVRHILIPGVSVANWDRVLATAALRETYYAALGLHPLFVEQHQLRDLDLLRNYIEKSSPVAIGEIGLDFYVEGLDREKQKKLFEGQLNLAREYKLPVVLHVRKAHDQVLKKLREKKLAGGFVHAFSGSEQQAHQYIDLGYKLGFGGTLTYERASKLRKLVSQLPVESIVIETDSPDMPPAFSPSQRNTPQNIPKILDQVSILRNESTSTIAEQFTNNFLFTIEHSISKI